jgi:hypothetical protein
MAAPLNTCTTIEQRGVVRFCGQKNMDAAKDIDKEMLPIWAALVPILCQINALHTDSLYVSLILLLHSHLCLCLLNILFLSSFSIETLEYESDRLSQNVGNYQPIHGV